MLDTILTGDAWQLAKTLPDQSVQCIITSPPYFGLRDYQTASWEGGDPACDHKPSSTPALRGLASSTLDGGKGTTGHQREGYAGTCARCGARRIDAQFGLEPTIGEYVARLVELFRELRRALRDDGVVFINLGDSYASTGGPEPAQTKWQIDGASHTQNGGKGRTAPRGLKPKDLCMIPARVALALQDDGWWLRSEIVWHKPNPMPESVGDRPTRAHEMVYLLAKSQRYYYDADAIREPHKEDSLKRYEYGLHSIYANAADYGGKQNNNQSDCDRMGDYMNYAGRNRRSVWTIATQPYPGSHFAVMPSALVEPCILAGTSARGRCPVCGAPWVRVVERTQPSYYQERKERDFDGRKVNGNENYTSISKGRPDNSGVGYSSNVTTGWRPTCAHDAEPVPCVVLDPFSGSGTVAAVAASLGRHYIGFELNPEYVKLAHERLRGVNMPLLAEAL